MNSSSFEWSPAARNPVEPSDAEQLPSIAYVPQAAPGAASLRPSHEHGDEYIWPEGAAISSVSTHAPTDGDVHQGAHSDPSTSSTSGGGGFHVAPSTGVTLPHTWMGAPPRPGAAAVPGDGFGLPARGVAPPPQVYAGSRVAAPAVLVHPSHHDHPDHHATGYHDAPRWRAVPGSPWVVSTAPHAGHMDARAGADAEYAAHAAAAHASYPRPSSASPSHPGMHEHYTGVWQGAAAPPQRYPAPVIMSRGDARVVIAPPPHQHYHDGGSVADPEQSSYFASSIEGDSASMSHLPSASSESIHAGHAGSAHLRSHRTMFVSNYATAPSYDASGHYVHHAAPPPLPPSPGRLPAWVSSPDVHFVQRHGEVRLVTSPMSMAPPTSGGMLHAHGEWRVLVPQPPAPSAPHEPPMATLWDAGAYSPAAVPSSPLTASPMAAAASASARRSANLRHHETVPGLASGTPHEPRRPIHAPVDAGASAASASAAYAIDVRRVMARMDPRTSLMIRNVPNRYRVHHLISELYAYGFAGRFDFLYLPIDVHTKNSIGYAFINMRTCQDVCDLVSRMTQLKWAFGNGSKKTCALTYARIQGLEQLRDNFNASIIVRTFPPSWQPLMFDAGGHAYYILPRSGAHADDPYTYIRAEMELLPLPGPQSMTAAVTWARGAAAPAPAPLPPPPYPSHTLAGSSSAESPMSVHFGPSSHAALAAAGAAADADAFAPPDRVARAAYYATLWEAAGLDAATAAAAMEAGHTSATSLSFESALALAQSAAPGTTGSASASASGSISRERSTMRAHAHAQAAAASAAVAASRSRAHVEEPRIVMQPAAMPEDASMAAASTNGHGVVPAVPAPPPLAPSRVLLSTQLPAAQPAALPPSRG